MLLNCRHGYSGMKTANDGAGTKAAYTTDVKPRVRDRILSTASELFFRRGIRGVGVEAIAAAAAPQDQLVSPLSLEGGVGCGVST